MAVFHGMVRTTRPPAMTGKEYERTLFDVAFADHQHPADHGHQIFPERREEVVACGGRAAGRRGLLPGSVPWVQQSFVLPGTAVQQGPAPRGASSPLRKASRPLKRLLISD